MVSSQENLSDSFELLFFELHNSKKYIFENQDQLNSQNKASQDKFLQDLFQKYKLFITDFIEGVQGASTNYFANILHDAEYLMTIYVDELFISFDWFGKDYWTNNLLEYELFGTHQAGDAFYEKLDGLIISYDATKSELAKVFILMLSLGFKGKYRGRKDLQSINKYKKILRNLLNINPDYSIIENEVMLKVHEKYVIQRKNSLKYRYRSYFFYFGIMLIIYLGCTAFYWDHAVSALQQYSSKSSNKIHAINTLIGIGGNQSSK